MRVFSLGFGPVLYSRVDKRGTRLADSRRLPFGGIRKVCLGMRMLQSGKDVAAMESAETDPKRLRAHAMAAHVVGVQQNRCGGPRVLTLGVVHSGFASHRAVGGRGLATQMTSGLHPLPFETKMKLASGDEIISIGG